MVGRQRRARSLDLGLAMSCGALAVLALPPFSQPALLPVAFGGLFILTAGHGVPRAALTGWAFGFMHFGLGLAWIAESFRVDAERFGHLALPSVAALAAVLALFPALAAATLAATRTRGLDGALVLASVWAVSEWLRGTVLTGFPWNLLGYAWAEFDIPRQVAAWTGSYGLSLLTMLAALLPVVVLASPRRERAAALVLLAGLASTVWLGAAARLWHAPPDTATTIRIVQPNVPQDEKWDGAYRARNIARLFTLSARPGAFDLLVWPETAYPGYIEEEPDILERAAALLPAGGTLLAGAVTRSSGPDGPVHRNAVLALDASGKIVARYAKHHLVPFGEYVPWRGVLPLERFTEGLGDFTPGPGPDTLMLDGAPPVGPVICYEAIFPGRVVDDADRPDWIFNATNDGWFGRSIGPRQHLAAARMRAVEEGLPVVRAANTGVSAVIDATGQIRGRIELGETGILDAALPAPRRTTFFALYGQTAFMGMLLVCLFGAALLHRRKETIV